MSDAVTERFSDLDYPGRKKPVNREGASPPAPDSAEWDDRPVHYLVNGEKREFFLISHLAKALGYSVQSIRAWEAQGLLARTPYRSPRTKAPVAAGRSNKGKRLWTREQIVGIIRIAKRHKVIFPDRKGIKHPPTPDFAREVGEFFSTLTAQDTH
jgi:hypothetical protein